MCVYMLYLICSVLFLLWPNLGLHFALDHLDASTAPPSLRLSDSSLTVTYHEENPPVPAPEGKIGRPVMTSDPGTLHHIRADVVIARGQYYWEVEVCNSSIYKIGKNNNLIIHGTHRKTHTVSKSVALQLPSSFLLCCTSRLITMEN